jgi:two-component system chemotaxis response regulator CheY
MIKQVLIADDSAVTRKMVQRSLEVAGLKGRVFLHAGNGAEALALLEAQPIDLLVTDLNMPVMDGPELLRSMATRPACRGVRVVVVTSVASGAWEAELRALGASAVVRKPLTAESFPAVLAELETRETPQ